MMQFNNKFIVLFSISIYLCTILSLSFSSSVYAAGQTIRVSPVIINVTLSPGKSYNHEVTVENLSSAPLPLRASLNDFITSGEDGGFVFETTKNNPLLSWIKLSETEFILNPKEKKTITLTIKTPPSIALGGYYGILFFEPVVQNSSSNGPRVSSKVGVLMLANVGVQDPNATKAEIMELKTPFVDEDGNIPLLLRVKNISLNFFTAKPELSISPLLPIFPQSPQQLSLEDKIVFPGKVRRWTKDTAIQGLTPNVYRAQMAVSTGNGQFITTEKYLVVFPFIKASGLLATVLVILFLISKRKRLKKALQALYK